MPTVTQVDIYHSYLPTSSTILYTVPGSTKTTVTSIVIANKDTVTRTVTLLMAGVELLPTVSVLPKQIFVLDIRQTIAATNTIQGMASAASVVSCHISGAEVA